MRSSDEVERVHPWPFNLGVGVLLGVTAWYVVRPAGMATLFRDLLTRVLLRDETFLRGYPMTQVGPLG